MDGTLDGSLGALVESPIHSLGVRVVHLRHSIRNILAHRSVWQPYISHLSMDPSHKPTDAPVPSSLTKVAPIPSWQVWAKFE